MTAPIEGSVRLTPDSIGSRVRTWNVVVLQADGTYATEVQQVVGLVDPATGAMVDLAGMTAAQEETVRLLRKLVLGLSMLLHEDLFTVPLNGD